MTSHAFDERSAEMMMEENWPYYAGLKEVELEQARRRTPPSQRVGPPVPDRQPSTLTNCHCWCPCVQANRLGGHKDIQRESVANWFLGHSAVPYIHRLQSRCSELQTTL